MSSIVLKTIRRCVMPADTNGSWLAEAFHGSAFDFLKAIATDRGLGMEARVGAAVASGVYRPKPEVTSDTNQIPLVILRHAH